MKNKKAKLYGLILAGGKSTRMGNDKGLIAYHGKPQREYLFKMAEQYCDAVYYSAREDQLRSFSNQDQVIIDQNEYRGPFNGILSAHHTFPKVAWLVLACDLPMLNKDGLSELVHKRDISKFATALSKKASRLPEPLITIWEPTGLKAARQYLKDAQSSCPRKFLMNSDIALVESTHEEQLYNANSVEDFKWVKEKLG